MVDRLTKYAHFISLAHPYTATTVAQLLLDNIYKLHGFPQTIVHDRDTIFMSVLEKEMFRQSVEVVEVVDVLLRDREAAIQLLRHHLMKAYQRMVA